MISLSTYQCYFKILLQNYFVSSFTFVAGIPVYIERSSVLAKGTYEKGKAIRVIHQAMVINCN